MKCALTVLYLHAYQSIVSDVNGRKIKETYRWWTNKVAMFYVYG